MWNTKKKKKRGENKRERCLVYPPWLSEARERFIIWSSQLLALLFPIRYCTGQACKPQITWGDAVVVPWKSKSGSGVMQRDPTWGSHLQTPTSPTDKGGFASHQLNIPPQRPFHPALWFYQLFNWYDSFPSTKHGRFKWDTREEHLIISLHLILSPVITRSCR